jgi:hypothetical protein
MRKDPGWEWLDALTQGPATLLPWPLFGRTSAWVQPGEWLSEILWWEEGEELLMCRLHRPANNVKHFLCNVTVLYIILKSSIKSLNSNSRFPKVEDIAEGVIGRWLVLHFPIYKGYTEICQCWYDKIAALAVTYFTQSYTPYFFGM